MRIRVLMENTSLDERLACRHGLSIHVETDRHRVLLDVGPDDTYLYNARQMGIDVGAVDAAVLSHGHFDHGGGLESFFTVNENAPLYIRPAALDAYYSTAGVQEPRYIGLPPAVVRHRDRMRFTGTMERIDEALTLFSGVKDTGTPLSANQRLRRKEGGAFPQDDFRHEQHLLVSEGGKAVLLAGCAHSGIVPIMERCREILGRAPDVVLGGFHLYSPGSGETEPEERIRAIGEQLARWPTTYYTGHCTGPAAFGQLKQILGDQLRTMTGGLDVTIRSIT